MAYFGINVELDKSENWSPCANFGVFLCNKIFLGG